MKGLAGHTALVTGAGRGIGKAIALRLSAEGMSVVVNDRDRPSAEATVLEITNGGRGSVAVVGDVSDEAVAKNAIAVSVQEFGGLHALINNAGVDISGPIRDLTLEKWSSVHAVDLWAPALWTREAEEALAVDGGVVINISSTHSVATVPHRSAYASAKAGLVGLTRAMAIDLGARRIRVMCVLPGYIQTPIWDLWLRDAPDPQGLLRKISARHPMRRVGEPADVAGVVAFLISSDAAFMTGSTVVVDGGYTALLESPIDG